MKIVDRSYRLVAALLLSVIFLSCSARQEFAIAADGAGRATIEIEIAPSFAEYLTDLGAGIGDADAPVIDTEAITDTFLLYPDLTLLDIEQPGEYRLRLTVAFTAIEAFLRMQDRFAGEIIAFDRDGNARTLTVLLDRRGVERALAFAGFDPMVTEIVLPPVGEMEESEYRDYLTWALEEYERDEPLERVFDRSIVTTTVTVEGSIDGVTGGVEEEGGVRFSTGLLHLVTTGTPVEYTLRFLVP